MNIDERKTKYSGKEYLAVISLYTKTGIPIRRARTATTGDSILLVYFVRSPPPFTRNMTRWYRVADIDGEKHHQSDATDCKWQEQQPYVLCTPGIQLVHASIFVNCTVFFCTLLQTMGYLVLASRHACFSCVAACCCEEEHRLIQVSYVHIHTSPAPPHACGFLATFTAPILLTWNLQQLANICRGVAKTDVRTQLYKPFHTVKELRTALTAIVCGWPILRAS